MLKRLLLVCVLFGANVIFAGTRPPPTEITLWHSFSGDLGIELNTLVDVYNHGQDRFFVKPIYKGDYISALTSFAAAFHAKQPPALMQVFEVGTASMLVPAGIIKPAEALMRAHHRDIPKQDFFPAVRDFYSVSNELQALPFNISVPVMFYNADSLAKVGYNASNFPKTWDELEILTRKLRASGVQCGYTSAFPSWILVESFSALHGLSIINPETHEVNFKDPAIFKHLTRLQRWQKNHDFEYGGRSDDATMLFTSGRCALFSQSSGGYHSLAALVPFHLGVAPLPIDQSISTYRYPNVVGGAALWAIQGHSKAVYAGIADFYAYWMQVDVQKKWTEKTGYIPLGVKGIYAPLKQSNASPTLPIAEGDFEGSIYPRTDTELGPLNFIRTIHDEALEAIFSGMSTPKEAMNEAMLRSNYALMRFRHNTAVG